MVDSLLVRAHLASFQLVYYLNQSASRTRRTRPEEGRKASSSHPKRTTRAIRSSTAARTTPTATAATSRWPRRHDGLAVSCG